jgi:hypothetical protein
MRLISQDYLPRLQADRPIFKHLPITTADEFKLIWEQEDNYTGLQQWRGLNGAPPVVSQPGVKQFSVNPGVYGETMNLDEERLTTARNYGVFGTPMDISEMVAKNLIKLLGRRLDRIETIGWNILQGSYSVAATNGAIVASDSYPVQTYTASTSWSTHATATPFGDMAAVSVLHRGHSVDFGPSAEAIMNLKTWNNMLLNTNIADMAGRRIPGLVTLNNAGDVNKLLNADGLPTITVYDQGYLNDSETFVPFIPDNTVILIGKRPAGQMVGEYRMTKNVNNPNGAPGAYTRVIIPQDHMPTQVQVHDGHNGGPVILYPSAIVVMSV